MARLKEVLIVRKTKTERTRSIGFESFSATPKGFDSRSGTERAESDRPQAVVQQVSSREFSELHRDEEVETALETVPLCLIEPRSIDQAPPTGDAWGLEAIGATTTTFTGQGVTVAVLDTGIDETHPAFTGVTLIKRNFTREGNGEADVTDHHGHGTHCAGTIFGRDVEGKRIGIARGVGRAVIGKVLGKGGGSTGSLFTAINWAIEQGAQVVSMSLGMDFVGLRQQFVEDGMHELAATSEILRLVVENVRFFDNFAHTLRTGTSFGRGALVFAASGNESERRDVPRPFTLGTAFPAATQEFVSVGAIERTGEATPAYRVATFSNAGAKLAAPGVDILSAAPGGGLQLMSGTSMATPHVAGLAALWYQKVSSRSKATPEKVLEAINQTVRRAEDLGLAEEDVGNGVPQAPK